MKHDPLTFGQQMVDAYQIIWLEREALISALNYEMATAFCSNCPHRERDDDGMRYVADRCCKDDPDYLQHEVAYLTRLEDAMKAIKSVLGDSAEAELNAARERIVKG
jgi:hypothetical protein